MSTSLPGLALACGMAAAIGATGCTTPPPRPEREVPVQPSLPVAQATAAGVVLHHPRPGLYSSAQPTAADWRRLPALGIGTVINLRPPADLEGRDEAAEVRAAGLAYVNIPIAGPDALTPANARALSDAISATRGGVLVHCSSGNRAGALLALAAHADGMAATDALALGKASGLAGLEPAVRGKLGLPAAACKPGDATRRC